MLFHTYTFLIFSTILFAALAVFRGFTQRKIVLLAASYVFYMWWNPAFGALVAVSTLVDYAIGLALNRTDEPRKRKALVAISVSAQLGLLMYFKYAGFLAENLFVISRLLGFEGPAPTFNITLPIGISFYTFATLSYSIDIYRKQIPATRSLLDFALFIIFFPHLIAGPIVRAAQLIPQLERPARLTINPSILFLFLGGLIKKTLVADNVAVMADAVYANPEQWPSAMIWLATIAFAVQIYCDFSGYSDMAIAIARALGYELPVNFRHPYFAINPSDFWRRWHITLSLWLKDYLYIPLGGNRHGTLRTYANLTLTMLLGGLWHGASWNFALWGLWHGLLLVAHRAYRQIRERWLGPLQEQSSFLSRTAAKLLMQYCVLISWIMFRVPDAEKMLIALRKFVFFDMNFSLAGIGAGSLFIFSTTLLLSGFAALHFWSYKHNGLHACLARMPLKTTMAACAAAGLALILLWPLQEAPFIYFQF
ncbi:MAG: MBOAT family protein [Elusimicrobia bacterium]|nr:MBOAT family protein [Elusimicrobiota bacterium]